MLEVVPPSPPLIIISDFPSGETVAPPNSPTGEAVDPPDSPVGGVGPCGLNNRKRDRLRMQKKQQQSI